MKQNEIFIEPDPMGNLIAELEILRMENEHLKGQVGDFELVKEKGLLLERRLQQAQKLESLGVLAGGIAHDFNNLLMGILGNANLALLRLPEISPSRSFVEGIEKASERAAALTRQMLAYSGKGKFHVKRVGLSEIVDEMVCLLETSISKNAQLDMHLAFGIPRVKVDVVQIQQIVMNLITNASDAIPGEAKV